MKLSIIAVGNIRHGAERELIDDYISRLRKSGRTVGFRGVAETECASGGGRDSEAERLVARCGAGARIVLLDETGQVRNSADFAEELGKWRDAGYPEACFLVGGAEGHGQPARDAATDMMALGIQTWPHKLVRVMLAEQLYRAATILAGLPYHKA